MLYNTIRHLSKAPVSDTTYDALLHDIEQPLGLGQGNICLMGEEGYGHQLINTPVVSEVLKQACSPENCSACNSNNTTRVHTISRLSGGLAEVISTPIKDQDHHYGMLMMEIPYGHTLEEWQMRSLEAAAHHIGMSLSYSRQLTEKRRLMLLEERSVIARELHDSLAQALSYLKIQITRLELSLAQGESEEKIQAVIAQLKEGTNSAYRQLRELLTTFRLSVDDGGLRSALEKTVDEFRARSSVEIVLDNRLDCNRLTVNEEIHIHQIIREALSNVIHHAEAKHAVVRLKNRLDQSVVMTVEDDGKGLPENTDIQHHYGLAIMQERARSLHGELIVSDSEKKGTQVQLLFMPAQK
jgi:two-component system nitrate/nitrite sensor histidine kinase NarX